MGRRLSRRLLSLAILAGLAAAGQAQNANRPRTVEERLSDPIYMSWVAYESVSECVQCHAGPSIAGIDSGSDTLTEFSRREEMMFWLEQDKHTIARSRIEPFERDQSEDQLLALYDRMQRQISSARQKYEQIGVQVGPAGMKEVPEELIGESNILSRRICDKLWGEGAITTPDGYQKFRDACLTCHGGYQPGSEGFDLATLNNARLGIDCLYCHQIGDDDRWVTPHQDPQWREEDPESKSRLGLRNLVGTSTQADLCFDCHVGNRDKNMFVTHEMYAAGHPPIPSIEVQKFCEEMPQHWQTPSQLYESLSDYDKRDEYFKLNYPGVTERDGADKVFWKTRKMLIGALQARKKSMQLYADTAKPQHDWADYSLYDCAACHHELKSVSLRQQRGFPGAPGRPRQHEWPDALLDILYGFGSLSKAADLELRLETQFAMTPFGDPAQVGPTAKQLAVRLKSHVDTLEKAPVNARTAGGLLRQLTETPQSRLFTYDAGRQVVWAMQTIADELTENGVPLNPNVVRTIRRLGDPETVGINAKLPSGRKVYIYPGELGDDLKRRAAYDPVKLKAQLDQIRQELMAWAHPSRPAIAARQ